MNRHLVRLVLAVAALSQLGADDPGDKRLIEFGWDEPDTAFLRAHFDEMARTPFDGCVFHANFVDRDGKTGNMSWVGWGRRAFQEEDFRGAFADLRALSGGRFRHHFLRVNVTPGDVDWFEDFTAIVSNARLMARLAKTGGCDGILFDVEQYEAPLFDYSKQRNSKTRSWAEYAAQARRRGGEVMRAFQEGQPGLAVLLTFGHSLPYSRMRRSGKPLAEVEYGLLAPFLDGMIDAAEGGSRIIDGHELSYGYREPAQFDEALRVMREGVLPIVAEPERYRRFVTPGFGLWMDYDWRTKGWDTEAPLNNYFTPEGFESSVRVALARTETYVWIYTETPRWWSAQGGPVKLPEGYDAALRRARAGVTR